MLMTKLKTVLKRLCVNGQKSQSLWVGPQKQPPGGRVASLLLGQKCCPVGLHLLQPLGQVAVGHLHLLNLVQCCS